MGLQFLRRYGLMGSWRPNPGAMNLEDPMATNAFENVALTIVERPSYSPHRMFLRTVARSGGGGGDVYHIQQRKSGAGRGQAPVWGDFEAADALVMREIQRRWNAHERLVEALLRFVRKYNAAPDGPLGIGLVNGDFLAARDLLVELGVAL